MSTAEPTALRNGHRVSGPLAAAVTPLRDGGGRLDESAFAPLVDFLHRGGLTGILALGTTGEGILLRPEDRCLAVDLFLSAAPANFAVLVNCGAQSTADTVALAAYAAEAGAAGIAVIAPPYFPLDDKALLNHFTAAAEACAPAPFYIYELEHASGYAVPPRVVDELRSRATNLVGMKVSDSPWERFAPYLIDGLDVFVGPEALISRGIREGQAVGAVSALATAFPELVAQAVRSASVADSDAVGQLRQHIERYPRHAALKHVLAHRGVPIRQDVTPPLRMLSADEVMQLDAEIATWLAPVAI
jgi:dihydrodipicolinate synthase/N-acetylneuraminate lyase